MSNESTASCSHSAAVEPSKICRICLTTITQDFIDVLDTEDFNLAKHVFEYFKVEVKSNDGKSTKLCIHCMERIDIWRGHLQQAHNSQIVVKYLYLKKKKRQLSTCSPTVNEEQSKNYNNQTASTSNNDIGSVSSTINMIESTSDHMIECTSTFIEPSMSNCNTVLECNGNLSIQKELQLPGKDTKVHRYHTRSSTSKLVKNICPFCIHKPPQVAHSYNIIFCVKHAYPFTCLVKGCYTVFPNKTVFLPHYRNHLQLDKTKYLCSKCFGVLGCSKRPTKKSRHEHQQLSTLFNCCSKNFTEMNDFVLHKLHYHPSKIVMAGDKNRQTIMMKESIKIEEVKKDEGPDVGIVEKNKHLCGELMCSVCQSYFSSLTKYIEHSMQNHNHVINLKEPDIKLCPLCDINYHCNKFIEHIEHCTNTMRVGKKELNRFWCVNCDKFFCDLSAYKFRTHVIYCRSFKTLIKNDVEYKKCMNCTFESDNIAYCLSHANNFCLKFQLDQKYARKPNEKNEVLERIYHVENPVQPTVNHTLSTMCDKSRKLFLINDYYNFICYNCNKGFFDKHVFIFHVNESLKRCRDPNSVYCPNCITDFKNLQEFNSHLSDDNLLIPPALSTLLIKEEDNSNSSNSDDIYCPSIASSSDEKVFGNSFILEQEIANTSTDFMEIESPTVNRNMEFLEAGVSNADCFTLQETEDNKYPMCYMQCKVEEKPIIEDAQ